MKKFLYAAIFFPVLAFWLFPIPLPSQGGVYNTTTGLLWCSYYDACIHEVGHKLDDTNGWISHTREFGDSVYMFIATEMIAHDTGSDTYKLATKIMRMPGVVRWGGLWLDSQSEIYATIFTFSGGEKENMPDIFQKYYDWDEAERLLKKHQRFEQEEPWQ